MILKKFRAISGVRRVLHLWYMKVRCTDCGRLTSELRRVGGRLDLGLRQCGLVNEMTYCVEELCSEMVVRNAGNGAVESDPRRVYQFARPLNMTPQTLAHMDLPVKFQFDGDFALFQLKTQYADLCTLHRLCTMWLNVAITDALA